MTGPLQIQLYEILSEECVAMRIPEILIHYSIESKGPDDLTDNLDQALVNTLWYYKKKDKEPN